MKKIILLLLVFLNVGLFVTGCYLVHQKQTDLSKQEEPHLSEKGLGALPMQEEALLPKKRLGAWGEFTLIGTPYNAPKDVITSSPVVTVDTMDA